MHICILGTSYWLKAPQPPRSLQSIIKTSLPLSKWLGSSDLRWSSKCISGCLKNNKIKVKFFERSLPKDVLNS